MSIEIKNINYKIKDKIILNDINLLIKNNEITSIIGPNGSGKSSLLKIISGDFSADNGEILFDDTNLISMSLSDQAMTRSVMSQSQVIVYDYSVKDIVELGWISDKHENFEQLLYEVCEKCEILDLLNRKYNSLSGGEQRNVNFARTLFQLSEKKSSKKRYFFLDEPTENLDIAHKIKLMNILNTIKHDGFGILLIIHDLNLAYRYSDNVGLLKKGELRFFGKTNEIMTNQNLSYIFDTDVVVDKKNKIIKYY
tara:strand:- start:2431 stop:3189 length:759 start_codon:yes stop_codon:yes gene_type:complete